MLAGRTNAELPVCCMPTDLGERWFRESDPSKISNQNQTSRKLKLPQVREHGAQYLKRHLKAGTAHTEPHSVHVNVVG